MKRIAYFTSVYPAISHTFISREIRALREEGLEICTYSIRKPLNPELLDRADQAEYKETDYLLAAPQSIIWFFFQNLLCHPFRIQKIFLDSIRMALFTPRSILLHLIYALEAQHLAHKLQVRGIRHIHVHFGNNALAVAHLAVCFDPQLSYSVSIHGPQEFRHDDAKLLKSRLEDVRFVRCISDYARREVLKLTEGLNLLTQVIHCGVPTTPLHYKSTEKTQDNFIFSVGRLVPDKGFEVLIRAFHNLNKKYSVELRIAGEGEARASLEALIEELQLKDRVKLLGAYSNEKVLKEMARARVFALLSFAEGIPVSLMEAMALGVPVLSTSIAGIPELIQNGESGFLVPSGDANAATKALEKLLSDESTRLAFTANAHKMLQESFSIKTESAKLAKLFSQL